MQVWWACWPFSFRYWTCGGEGSQKDNPVSWFGAYVESVAVFVSSDCWRWLGSRKKRQICARCRLYHKKLHENLTNTPDKLLKKLQTKIWFQGTLCSSFIWVEKREDIILLPHTIAGPSVMSHRWCIMYVWQTTVPKLPDIIVMVPLRREPCISPLLG